MSDMRDPRTDPMPGDVLMNHHCTYISVLMYRTVNRTVGNLLKRPRVYFRYDTDFGMPDRRVSIEAWRAHMGSATIIKRADQPAGEE
jgi:hypothetical protein